MLPGIRNVCNIMQYFTGDKIAVVVSATGKTTNALEEVVKSYFARDGQANKSWIWSRKTMPRL